MVRTLGPGTSAWVHVSARLRADLGERFRAAVLAAEGGDLRALRAAAAGEAWEDLWGGALPPDLAEVLSLALARVQPDTVAAGEWLGVLRTLVLRRALRLRERLVPDLPETVADICVRLAGVRRRDGWVHVDPSRRVTAVCPRGRRARR